MKAVILAGGLGSRLRPLGQKRPKPMLPLPDRPLLAHSLDRLDAAFPAASAFAAWTASLSRICLQIHAGAPAMAAPPAFGSYGKRKTVVIPLPPLSFL